MYTGSYVIVFTVFVSIYSQNATCIDSMCEQAEACKCTGGLFKLFLWISSGLLMASSTSITHDAA